MFQAGAFDLSALFRDGALRHENEVVACSKVRERFRHAGDDFNRVLRNRVCEAVNGFM